MKKGRRREGEKGRRGEQMLHLLLPYLPIPLLVISAALLILLSGPVYLSYSQELSEDLPNGMFGQQSFPNLQDQNSRISAKIVVEPNWRYKTQESVFNVFPFDLDGDGRKEVIAGADTLYVLDYSGNLKWRCEEACKSIKYIRSLYVADLNSDGQGEVLAGPVGVPHDTPSLYVFDFQGGILWKTGANGTINSLYVVDLNLDGKGEILASSSDGALYVWDYQGNLQWTYHTGGPDCKHVSGCAPLSIYVFNLDKKGPLEVLVGSEDGSIYLLGANGKLLSKFPTRGSVLSLYVSDMGKDQPPLVLTGSLDKALYALKVEENQGTLSLKLAWKYETDGSVNVVYAFDLDGDGFKEVLGGSSDNTIYVLDRQGQLQWNVVTEGEVVSLGAFDLDADGTGVVIAGSNDRRVYLLNPLGELRWEYEVPGFVYTVYPADMDGDGKGEVVIGSDNVYLFGYQSNLTVYGPIWNYETSDPLSGIYPVDTDGDGNKEILVGTIGSELYVLDSQGNFKHYHSISSEEESEQSLLSFIPYQIKPRGELRYRSQAGDNITTLAAYDLEGDAKDEVIVGLESGRVLLLRDEGVGWRYKTDGSISSMLVTDLEGDKTPEILVGSEDGSIHLIDLHGAQQWHYKTAGRVNILVAVDLDEDDEKEILIGGEDHILYALSVHKTTPLQGKLKWYYETGGDIVDISAADLDADGELEIVLIGRDETLYVLNNQGQLKGTKKVPSLNTFYPEDLDGDETLEIIIGSYNGTLSVLDAQQNLRWSHKLEKGIVSLVVTDLDGDQRGEILVGCRDENLYIFDHQGRLIWKYRTPGVPQTLYALDLDQDGNIEIILGFEEANIMALNRIYNTAPFILEAGVEAIGKDAYRYTLHTRDVNGGYLQVGLEVYDPSHKVWKPIGKPKLVETEDKARWQLSGFFDFWDRGLSHRYRFFYNDQGLTGTWGEFRGSDVPGIPWYVYAIISLLSLVIFLLSVQSYLRWSAVRNPLFVVRKLRRRTTDPVYKGRLTTDE